MIIFNIIFILSLSVIGVLMISIFIGEKETLEKNDEQPKIRRKFLKVIYKVIILFLLICFALSYFLTAWYLVPLILMLLIILMFLLPKKFPNKI